MLNPLLKMTEGFAPRNRRRNETVRPLIALLSIAWVIAAAGCHSKDTPPSTTGQPGAGAAAQKPTAEQDAAKQRGEQQGAAIQAANQAASGAAPGVQ